uniref:UPF0235 protein n=1 Tax=Parastrongyloides trichosuri TaxID=131310 RepID=A0A0N4ZRQ7_PARTI
MGKKSITKEIKNKDITKIKTEPIYINNDGSITIKIYALPGAKQNAILDISSEGIRTQINSPPIDGKANEELLSFYRSVLDLRKNELFFDKGMKSRSKLLIVNSPKYNLQNVLEKINNELAKK